MLTQGWSRCWRPARAGLRLVNYPIPPEGPFIYRDGSLLAPLPLRGPDAYSGRTIRLFDTPKGAPQGTGVEGARFSIPSTLTSPAPPGRCARWHYLSRTTASPPPAVFQRKPSQILFATIQRARWREPCLKWSAPRGLVGIPIHRILWYMLYIVQSVLRWNPES